MLADHLGDGDYTITRVVFVVLLIAAAGALVASIAVARGRNRLLGLFVAALLAFAAVRVLHRWEDVTGAADRLTGPTGGEVVLGELGHFLVSVFGGASLFGLLVVLVALAVSVIDRRRPDPA